MKNQEFFDRNGYVPEYTDAQTGEAVNVTITYNEELPGNEGDKFYPGHHMWTYCTFLGKYTASNGENFDLGIYKHPRFEGYLAYSNATVWGPEDHEYSSGSLMFFKDEPSYIGNEVNAEVVKRARAKGINVELKEITNG
jgi:hypothetical protein